jgi:hypothetical protein
VPLLLLLLPSFNALRICAALFTCTRVGTPAALCCFLNGLVHNANAVGESAPSLQPKRSMVPLLYSRQQPTAMLHLAVAVAGLLSCSATPHKMCLLSASLLLLCWPTTITAAFNPCCRRSHTSCKQHPSNYSLVGAWKHVLHERGLGACAVTGCTKHKLRTHLKQLLPLLTSRIRARLVSYMTATDSSALLTPLK